MRFFQILFKSILFLIIGEFCIATIVAKDEQRSIFIDCLSDHYKQQIQELLPESLYIQTVSYDLDFSYDQSGLYYLTGLQDFTTVTRKELISACFYIRQIDRFKKIDLIIEPKGSGYQLHFVLGGQTVFYRLSISGFARDKEKYKNMYLLDVGEVFDSQKHKHSLEQIQQAFYDKGYCNVALKDTIQEQTKNKNVVVDISLSKGSIFTINNVEFQVHGVGAVVQVDVLRIEKDIIDVCYKRLRSKVYTQELLKKVKEKIKAILSRNGFMDFDISVKQSVNQALSKVDLVFTITIEQKKEFLFFGNHFFSSQQILEQLLMYGKSSWHFPKSIIIDEVGQLYKNKGFWNVDITVKEEKNRTFCLINEGDRVSIKHVYFKNNNFIHSHELQHEVFKKFLHEKYFDKESFKKTLDGLIKFYKQRGFWDFKIIKEEFVLAKESSFYDLVLTVDEGLQRIIGSYKIPEYPELEGQAPFVMDTKKINQGFDPMIILEQKQWLVRYFRNKGYNKVGVEYTLQEQGNKKLDLLWNIKLDEQAMHFGKPLIIGNSVVPTSYILKEIAFKEGDVWDKDKLEGTLKNLRSLDVFDSVQIYPSREVDNDLYKPIFIKVIDGSRYEVKTRLGAQQVGNSFVLKRGFTYKIGGSFILKNPFHYGDKFLIETDFTKFYRDVAAIYQFPWLFGRSIRCQYKLYDNVYDQPVYIGSKYSLYQAAQRGFLFNMSKILSAVTMSGSAGVEYMGIKQADEPDLGSIIDYDSALLGKNLGYLFLEPNIVWQKTDNMVNPTRGHLSYVSLKGMIDLNHKTSFLKILVEHSWYIPLLEPLVLAVRMRGGHVFNRKYSQIIPIERFYLGGESTIRGYDRDYCPPLGRLTVPIHDASAGLPAAACNTWRFAPQGGRTMINLNTELRFPVYKGLSGALFTDIGALFKDSVKNALKDHSDTVLAASGFGVRYNTPIGPLRFDLGFKWNKTLKDFETRSVWYLTFGQAF